MIFSRSREWQETGVCGFVCRDLLVRLETLHCTFMWGTIMWTKKTSIFLFYLRRVEMFRWWVVKFLWVCMLVISSDQHYMLWNHVWILFFYGAVYLAAANYFRSGFKLVLWAQHFVFTADSCKGRWQARGSNCISCKKIVSNYFAITHITYQKMTELQNYFWFIIVIYLRTMVFAEHV